VLRAEIAALKAAARQAAREQVQKHNPDDAAVGKFDWMVRGAPLGPALAWPAAGPLLARCCRARCLLGSQLPPAADTRP
jgi:hypothetical protein